MALEGFYSVGVKACFKLFGSVKCRTLPWHIINKFQFAYILLYYYIII